MKGPLCLLGRVTTETPFHPFEAILSLYQFFLKKEAAPVHEKNPQHILKFTKKKKMQVAKYILYDIDC